MRVSIRPLRESDALTSYAWRNDPDIWRYTGKRPDREITPEMELEWIRKVLARPDEKRFAVCVGDEMEYVGNAQLTDISPTQAQFHIFIGKKEYHGKGIGTEATRLVLLHAFEVLQLRQVYLKVNRSNVAAVRAYEKCGFRITAESGSTLIMTAEGPAEPKSLDSTSRGPAS